MSDVKLKIQDAPLIVTPAGTNKVPVSDDSGLAKTISVTQINSVHEDKLDPHTQYLTKIAASTGYAPALGSDDNYVTDTEKAALHGHSNKAALDSVSGTNTGDQDLSGYVLSTSLATVATTGSYSDLSHKPTIPSEYTLPTASTTVLGGVKVDGTTITVTDGVITSTATGGVTAHNNLTDLDYASSGHTGFQETLVSGTNIKTINGTTILGSGDLIISGSSHEPVSVTDSTSIDLTLTGQALTAAAIFGTTAGTVAEGSHLHTGVYAPVLGEDDNYVTDAEKTKLANLSGTNSGDQDLSGYVLSTSLATVATTGSYTDLINTPTIPIQYTDEMAQDAVGAAITAGTQSGITVTYDDANNKLDFTVTASGGGDVTGPVSSATNNIAVFDGVTGKVIKDGGSAISDLATADHNHTGVYEPADSTLLKAADIGVTVQAYDADLTSWAAIAPSEKQDTLISGSNIKTINSTSLLGSGDIVITGGGTDIPVQADAPSSPSVGDLWVDSDALPSVVPSVVDLTSATSDYTLAVGQTATLTYTSATSVPLHVATVEGIYEVTLAGTSRPASANGDVILFPNNYTTGSDSNYYRAFSRTRLEWNGSNFLTTTNTYSGMPINYGVALVSQAVINTHLLCKSLEASFYGQLLNGDGNDFGFIGCKWNNATMQWVSLGTVAFTATAQSGKIVIKRII